MSHRRGATGSVTAPQTQSRTDGPERTRGAQIGVQGLETPWLRLVAGPHGCDRNWLRWFLLTRGGQLIDDGIGFEVDFRRCPFIGGAM